MFLFWQAPARSISRSRTAFKSHTKTANDHDVTPHQAERSYKHSRYQRNRVTWFYGGITDRIGIDERENLKTSSSTAAIYLASLCCFDVPINKIGLRRLFVSCILGSLYSHGL